MYLILSLILPTLGMIISLLITIYYKLPIWLIILLAIFTWIIILGIICIYILLALHFRGKKYAINYDPKDPKRWRFMNNVSSFSCFWLGLRIKKVGFEKLNTKNPVVFYSNHCHFTDIILYDLVLKDYPRGSMYKKEHNTNPIFGGMVKGLGGVEIDRDNDRAAIKSIMEITKRVNDGVNFMIYPEGTRSKDGNIGEYHPGSFRIVEKAKDAKLAILAIKYSSFIPISFIFFPRHVYIELVDVLDKEDFNDKTTVELAKEVEERTKQALEDAKRKYRYLR